MVEDLQGRPTPVPPQRDKDEDEEGLFQKVKDSRHSPRCEPGIKTVLYVSGLDSFAVSCVSMLHSVNSVEGRREMRVGDQFVPGRNFLL